MLIPKAYFRAIDVWSVGCIFAEILFKKLIFPGDNYLQHLCIILDLVGSPNQEDLDSDTSEYARCYLQSVSFRPKVLWGLVKEGSFSSTLPHVIDAATRINQAPSHQLSVDAVTS